MKYFIFLFVVMMWTGAFSQIDNSESNPEGIHIGRKEKKIGDSRHIGKGFSTKKEKFKTLLGQPDKLSLDIDDDDEKVDINKKSEFITRETKFEPAYLKKNKREGKAYGHSKPQDLGRYSTSGEYVIVSWRDAQVVDGDRVDILVNGKVVVRNVTLLARYHSIRVDLDEGFTKIEFKALNQGDSGPNTADFKVEDQNGSILIHDQWNLLTGVKAHLVVVKK